MLADRPVVLGLDPAMNRTGWACCDLVTGAPILCGRLEMEKLRKKSPIQIVIADAIYDLMEELGNRGLRPKLVYVEKHFVGKSRAATINLAEALGIHIAAVMFALGDEVPINRFRPSEWKALLGLSGNAPKTACVRWALQAGYEFHPSDTDAGEAGCIASAGWKFNEKGEYG